VCRILGGENFRRVIYALYVSELERPTDVSQLSLKYLAYLRFENSSAQFFTIIMKQSVVSSKDKIIFMWSDRNPTGVIQMDI